jgi:hypothetical protein
LERGRPKGAKEEFRKPSSFFTARDLKYPELDLIRGDARIGALRKKVGLPE